MRKYTTNATLWLDRDWIGSTLQSAWPVKANTKRVWRIDRGPHNYPRAKCTRRQYKNREDTTPGQHRVPAHAHRVRNSMIVRWPPGNGIVLNYIYQRY